MTTTCRLHQMNFCRKPNETKLLLQWNSLISKIIPEFSWKLNWVNHCFGASVIQFQSLLEIAVFTSKSLWKYQLWKKIATPQGKISLTVLISSDKVTTLYLTSKTVMWPPMDHKRLSPPSLSGLHRLFTIIFYEADCFGKASKLREFFHCRRTKYV